MQPWQYEFVDRTTTPGYPGLGLPLRYNLHHEDRFYPLGAHGNCYGGSSDILPVRELAMMSVMERLTDKEDWHKKVFDEEIVSKWREEALSIPDKEFWNLSVGMKRQLIHRNTGEVTLRDDNIHQKPLEGIMTKATFDFCVEELRRKARYYEVSGLIPTLDACASVVKSDKLVASELHDALHNAFDKLKADQAKLPDFHPNTKDMVQDLVHPSMYPLVYDRTKVIRDEVVGVQDAIERWSGKGDIIPKPKEPVDRFESGIGGSDIPPQFWSDTYQWLPANVAFQTDGSVKLQSYINNLHPKYSKIYAPIEKLIEAALPAWDQCLASITQYSEKQGAGRMDSRFPRPDDADDENPDNWIPSDPKDVAHIDLDWDKVSDDYERYDPEQHDPSDEVVLKWRVLRAPYIPEPEFNDLDYPQNDVDYNPNDFDYKPKPGHRLVEKFKELGLQVIVKMASIELTPDKPEFPVGGWHVEGQMNEHICGTALYYLDSENITSSSLSFRMQTSANLREEGGFDVPQNAYSWLEQIYGTSLGGDPPCLQNYGNVETREGRLLAFPNVFQHRVSPFRLIDPTKPGHRRFIALWLVDPYKRIISTANVPPQQQSWWIEAIFGSDRESRKSALAKLPVELAVLFQERGVESGANLGTGELPLELMEMVRNHFDANSDSLPMTLEEAKEHRLKLMKERSAYMESTEKGWQEHTYSFCEH